MTKLLMIEVDNNKCKVKNISPGTSRILTDRLSIKSKNYFFTPAYKSGVWDGYYRFYNRLGNSFATGLLPRVCKILDSKKIEYKLVDKRVSLKPKMLEDDFTFHSNKVLREYQEASVNDVLNNTVSDLPFLRGIVHVATNGGKTVMAGALIHQILPLLNNDIVLFLTHSKEIAYQTKENLEKDLKIDIGLIGDGEWDEKIVTVAMVPTLYKNMSDSKFKKLAKHVTAFIADECHHASSDSWGKVITKLSKASIRIGLTGTLPPDKIKELQLFSVIGAPILRIKNRFLIEKGFSAKPLCKYVLFEELELCKDIGFQEAYTEGIVRNTFRNKAIMSVTYEHFKKGESVLVLIERTEHGEILLELLKKLGVESVEFTHGQRTKDYRRDVLASLKNGSLKVLISTAILYEGVDVDNINVVVYGRGMESPVKLLQAIGRGLRKKKDGSNLLFYDFLDFCNKYLAEHTMSRYDTLVSENFEIEKVDFTTNKT